MRWVLMVEWLALGFAAVVLATSLVAGANAGAVAVGAFGVGLFLERLVLAPCHARLESQVAAQEANER